MVMLRAVSALAVFCLLPLSVFAADKEPAKDGPVDKDAVNAAIERGVAYLKKTQRKDGRWIYMRLGGDFKIGGISRDEEAAVNGHMDVGVTALSGLALLEAKLSAKDPAIQKAAEFVRAGTAELTWTHSIGLTILFLDRVGDANDIPLIKTLAARLLLAQGSDGGWGYQCTKLSVDTVSRWDTPEKFAQELARPRPRERQSGPGAYGFGGSMTENSCSEFAVMGLWIARRHGVPIAASLTRYETFCRRMQNLDGTFPYSPMTRGGPGSACMTAAGLYGLAHCYGNGNETALVKYAKNRQANKPEGGKAEHAKGPRDRGKDQALVRGLAALETLMASDGAPMGDAAKGKAEAGAKQLQRNVAAFGAPVAFNRWQPNGQAFLYMTLWSIERVGVIYDRDKIGKINWYNWGARMLLEWQGKDGSWSGSFSTPGLDSAFALLFLSRANPAPDLYLILKGLQPGQESSIASTETPVGKR
jgi:hypothetical protein